MANNYNYPNMPWSGGMPNYVDLTEPEDTKPSGSILNGLLSMVQKSTSEYDSVPGTSGTPLRTSTHQLGAPDMNNPAFAGAGVPLEQSAIHESSDKDKKKNLFHVDTNLIHSIPTNQQASELQGLGLEVFNQDEFEQGVMAQVDQALEVEENERMKKMMQRELKSVEDAIRSTKQEMQHIAKVISMLTPQSSSNREAARKLQSVTKQHNDKLKQLKKMTAKQKTLSMKINGNLNGVDAEELNGDVMQVLGLPSAVDETEHERMIRLGEMTPFGTVVNKPKETPRTVSMSKTPTDFEQFLLGGPPAGAKKPTKGPASKIKRSHTVTSVPKLSSKTVDKKANGSDEPRKKKMRKSVSDSSIIQTKDDGDDFDAINKSQKFKRGDQNMFDQKDKRTYYGDMEKDFSNYKSRRRIHPKLQHNFSEDKALSDVEIGDENDVDDYKDGDADYIPEAAEFDDADMSYSPEKKSRGRRKKDDPLAGLKRKDEDENWNAGETKKSTGRKKGSGGQVVNSRDDGNLDSYEARLRQHDRDEQKKTAEKMANGEEDSDSGSDLEIDSGFKVPGRLWNKLYRYQKTGVRWLWELHCQQAGGIVGDEMGLGKTLQTIAFLRGLRYSKLVDKAEHTRYRGLGPVIIVCPATVMHQWVKEFHTWSPEFRVAVLHNSGNYKGSEDALVRSVVRRNDIIITAYSGVTMFQDILLPHRWHYIILDEGHKIRNPDAQVTLACKQFRTCHRIILSGSPVQNNLKELWSLFDFVFPGKLGTLPDFMAHFSVPIVQGGYSNATQVQVQTAYKCACVLRDTINPYLLRRMKNDVKDNLCLPDKNEQVLFCRLTDHQKEVYKEYIDSKECNMILSGKFMVFPGLITLRKICNHPDISTGGPIVFDPKEREDGDETLEYGFWKRSGKLIVVESLLKLWKQQEHRVLLFTQSKQMLNILEEFVDKQGYTYRTMDGGTPISARQPLITRFNNDPSIFVFLLTTRVGGLGVNLTGANRVVIYDPDWNPSTDLQARERSWRIGQKRNVTIYRLLTAGTIEEKIYHRQIFKTFLTNRVLKDPKQRRFFKSNDLYELFTLGDDSTKQGTETSAIFAGTGSDIKIPVKKQSSQKSGRKNRFDELKKREKEIKIEDKSVLDKEEVEDEGEESVIQVAKLQKMRELARSLSKKIGKGEITGEDKSNNETSQKLKSESTACEKTSEMTKKDKEKGKKKKKRRDASLEGVKISYLKKHKTYQPAAEEEESADSKKDDDFVLQRLLKKSGVHSALQHDKIMLSSNPDYALVEGEAERVAKEAARALKHSRTRCNAATSGIPTWTGCSGQASSPSKPRFGQKKNPKLVSSTTAAAPPVQKLIKSESVGRSSPKPQPKHFDGTIAGNKKNSSVVIAKSAPDMMSSKELLTRMQSRNHLLLESQRGEDNDEIDETYVGRVSGASVNIDPETLESITDIRNHVAFGCAIDGQATTEEIMSEFGSKISHDQSANFKAMLKQICNFDKRNGIGIWQLKPEFR